MILDGPWAIPTYMDTVEFDFDVVPVPAGPAQRAPSLLGGTFVIDKDTDYPEAAFEFLSFITSESQLETIVAESGAGIPGRQSAFDKMTPLMEKAANYIMETNQAFYPVRGSFAIFDKQNSEFELIFNGEKSVEEGLIEVAAFARNVVRENYGD
jgi:multiple sugar transport system substrate-binding protein